jgi:DNA modification methylase
VSEPYYSDDHVTIYHGDCLELADLWTSADVMVTDPPYGISWSTHGSKRDLRGWAPRKAKAGIVGDDDTAARDAVVSVWGDRPCAVFGSPLVCPPDGAIQALVWRKPIDSGVIGARFVWRRDVELIFLLGSWPKVTPDRSSVLGSPGGMDRYRNGHPHVKPVPILTQLIEQTPPGVVADPFMGSGSTLRAAKDLGRKAIGIEIEERYCEIAAKRCAQEVLAL